ncbi:TMV resistance protein [Salix suchowensis]|nr:TMV resistance protein [Salix suchowensis]
MGSLKSLQTLNVTECSQLEKLPDSFGGLESLTLLNLEKCYSLKSLPESMGSLKSLQTLNVTECLQLEKLPDSFGGLESLTLLNLEKCYSLKSLPESMGSLKSLQTLNVTECLQLEKLPDSFGGLESLTLLNLEKCYSLKSLTESMGNLKSLQTLNVTECSQLEKLSYSLDGLESLTELFVKGTAIKQLPTSARYLKKLTKLSFGGFYSPHPPSKSRFSRFSSWLSPQSCSSSIAMRLDSFTSFTSLKKLDLSYAGLCDAISSIDFGSFSFLEDLNLSGNRFFNLPSGISRLPKIKYFRVERCENLQSISVPSNLAGFSIFHCTSIERVIAPLQSEKIVTKFHRDSCKTFYRNYTWCPNLIEVQGMDEEGLWGKDLSEDEDLRDEDLSEDEDLQDEGIPDYYIQGKFYEISLAGGEIPEWFSHRGEGSSLSFHLPSVSVPDGNKLGAFLVWVVFASPNEATALTPFLQRDMFSATLKNKSNGVPLKNKYGNNLFDKKAVLNFGRNSTKLSWINRRRLRGFELESLQGIELELNVKVRGLSDARKCWVEKCGVHFIMEKDKADDWKEILEYASNPDDQRMQSIFRRELQEGKIIGYKKRSIHFKPLLM